jgi:O-antigen biosynthesis protein
LLRLRQARRKFYFLQDWEPLFYPGGAISSLVEATYRFGFHGICNTPSLEQSYEEMGGQSDHFLPAIDTEVFHSRGRQKRARQAPFVLFCYARPGIPRNCFEAMSVGLTEVKRRYGKRIQIFSAGSEWDPGQYGLEGVVCNMGLLPYAETGAMYRSADAGLVAMATRHPSYLPFELIACGAAVVTNHNPHTRWLLRDGENCLRCEMTRSDIADAIGRLIEEPDLRDAIAESAAAEIAEKYSDWNRTCERIHRIIQNGVESPGAGQRDSGS